MGRKKTIAADSPEDHVPSIEEAMSKVVNEVSRFAVGEMQTDVVTTWNNTHGALNDIRYIVDLYYQVQDFRKSCANQKRATEASIENAQTRMSVWVMKQFENLEKALFVYLTQWTDRDPVSIWAKSITGVGAVIAAGLAAHIDIRRATNPSKIHRFAGLDPTSKWIGRTKASALVGELKDKHKEPEDALVEASQLANVNLDSVTRFAKLYAKDEKTITWVSLTKALARCPWNARLKVLCWKLGDSFCKCSGKPHSFYGMIYKNEKMRRVGIDSEGGYKQLAEDTMKVKVFSDAAVKKLYKSGHLPAGRLELQARRKAVKLFLNHWWEVAYESHYHKTPPDPWIIAHGGHTDVIHAKDAVQFEHDMQSKDEVA